AVVRNEPRPHMLDMTSNDGNPDAGVSRLLAAHGASATDWDHSALSREMHVWAERLTNAFFRGQLPPPVISFDREHPHVLGSYQEGRDSLGLRYHINLNALWL